MAEDRDRILDMLEKGRIGASEAAKLLDALSGAGGEALPSKRKARFLRVKVQGGEHAHVDVRVPLGLISAGVKLGALIPPEAQAQLNTAMGEHGVSFDLSNIKPENVQELVDALSDMEVNVTGPDGSSVHVYAE